MRYILFICFVILCTSCSWTVKEPLVTLTVPISSGSNIDMGGFITRKEFKKLSDQVNKLNNKFKLEKK